MISRIEAYRYRCFERLDLPLDAYHVLAGANGSGKSTLLDIPLLLRDMLQRGVSWAFLQEPGSNAVPRAQTFRDLIYRGNGDYFAFALEVKLPPHVQASLFVHMPGSIHQHPLLWPHYLRYELRLQLFNEIELQVSDEHIYILPEDQKRPAEGWGIGGERPKKGWYHVLKRESGGEVQVKPEYQRTKLPEMRLSPQELALDSLLKERHLFPATTWFREYLETDLLRYEPRWEAMRAPCPPSRMQEIRPDGSNLPWLVHNLHKTNADSHQAWVEHVRMALPDLVSVNGIERPDDHHAYLKVKYKGGYTVTSSGLSEGTLKILGLTLLPYLPAVPKFVCIEEPENSIHPRGIEMILQSLQSLYDSQVWLSTHSPIVLAHTELKNIICMRRSDGKNVPVIGTQHPRLMDWKGGIDLGTLFATGILG